MRIPKHSRVSVHSSQANSNLASQKQRTAKPLTTHVSRLARRRVYASVLVALWLVAGSIAGFAVRPRLVTQAAIPLGPEHVLSIPYYSIKGDWDSTLTLNNGGHTQLTPSVKLYSLGGEALQLPAVSLQPNDYTALRLSELVAASQRKGQFQEGSVELRFNSDDLFALAPQLTVSDSKHGLSFDMEPPIGLKSSILEGLWWSLDEKTSGKVMLSNTTAGELSIQLTIEWRSTIIPTPPISLSAHGTVVLEIDKLLKENGIDATGIERGGLSITHSGPAGALVGHGVIQDEARRFMSSLSFIDPAAQPTSALDGTGLMLGRSPRDSVFPEGSFFTPQLALKNASGSPQTATVTVRYTTDGRLETMALPVVRLEPHEVRKVDFSRLVAGLGNTPVSEAGLKIESSGEPGSLVASLASVDQAHSLVVDVPLESKKDNSAKGGNHPFRLDDNYRSVAYLMNITARPTRVAVIIFYDGGMFTPELINVAAGETVAVDLVQLRDSQSKDIQGRTLPRDLRKGQFFWHPHGGEALAGRVITFDKAAGTVSNFSCPNCCQLEPNRLEFVPAPLSGVVGESQQLTVNEWDSYCGQFTVGPNNYTNSIAYSCDNTSVATVSSGGLVSCVGLGSATVTASLSYYHSDFISAEDCGLFLATLTGGCPVTVVPPDLVGIVESGFVAQDTSSSSAVSGAIVSGQAFTLRIEARVPGTTRIDTNFNSPATVSFGHMVAGESVSPSPVPMSNGVGRTTVVVKVIDGTTTPTCCRTYGLAATAATATTAQLAVWFSVTMDIERWKNCNFSSCPNLGSYFCTSACVRQGFSNPFPFISLTADVCGASVIVRYTNPQTFATSTQATTVLDIGPTTTNPYWSTGTIPSIGGCVSDALADALGVPNGCNPGPFGEPSVLWRFQ